MRLPGFRYDYNKYTQKSAPQTPWENLKFVVQEKLFLLIKTNLIHATAMLPAIVWSYFSIIALFTAQDMSALFGTLALWMAGLFGWMIITAPFTTATYHLTDKWLKDKNVWYKDDFLGCLKRTYLKSVALMSIYVMLTVGLMAGLLFSQDMISPVFFAVKVMMFLVYHVAIMTTSYSFYMLANTDLKSSQILKYSAVLTLLNYKKSLVCMVVTVLPVLIIGALSSSNVIVLATVLSAYYTLMGFCFTNVAGTYVAANAYAKYKDYL